MVAGVLEVVMNVISAELDVVVVVAELVLELLWAVVAVEKFSMATVLKIL